MKDYFKKLKQLFSVKDLLFTVLLFGLILSLAFCKAESMMEVTFGDEAVDIVTSGYSMNIPYNMVDSVELGKINENDELVNGVADIALRTGIWTNEEWGEYYACMDVQTDNCVVVRLNDGRIFVFSHRSDEVTAEAYETLLGKLAK